MSSIEKIEISDSVAVATGINYSKNESIEGYLAGITERNSRIALGALRPVENSCACGLCSGSGLLWESVYLSFSRKGKALARVKRLVRCMACIGAGYDFEALRELGEAGEYVGDFHARLLEVQALDASI